MSQIKKGEPPLEDLPPASFRSWRQMYTFVLVFHTLLIAVFYAFMRAYS